MAEARPLLDPRPAISLATARPPAEVEARLREALSPEQGGMVARMRDRRPLAGAQQGERWVLRRRVIYPDPWRPEIHLQVKPEREGSRIEAELRWTSRAQTATRLWLGLTGLVAGGLTALVLAGPLHPQAMILVALAVLYAAFPWLDLRVEARATRQVLARVLV